MTPEALSSMPHRRQRPLAHNTYEYAVFHHSTSESPTRLKIGPRLVAIVLGTIAGLSTVGTGALVLPLNSSTSNPRVAGAQTTQAYNPQPQTVSAHAVCWNQVRLIENNLYWNDSCRGLIPSDTRKCIDRPLPLAESEIQAYHDWYYTDKVLPEACQAQAEELPTQNPFE